MLPWGSGRFVYIQKNFKEVYFMQENKSEVARLRRDIELTCQSMKEGFTGFASAARHAIIAHKYHQLGSIRSNLAQLVGEEQATELMVETYNKVVK